MIRKLIPMLFSTEMAKANMDGRKSETRRAFKKQPQTNILGGMCEDLSDKAVKDYGCFFKRKDHEYLIDFFKSPYGRPGDIIWMRETFAPMVVDDYDGEGNDKHAYLYKTDPESAEILWHMEDSSWKPNIHMPLEACRFFAEITEIRVERLHDISEESAKSEGAEQLTNMHHGLSQFKLRTPNYRTGFAGIWFKVNGEESWKQNPWVWVVKYKLITPRHLIIILPEILASRKPGLDHDNVHDALFDYAQRNGGLK
jgi:hypothetical protein